MPEDFVDSFSAKNNCSFIRDLRAKLSLSTLSSLIYELQTSCARNIHIHKSTCSSVVANLPSCFFLGVHIYIHMSEVVGNVRNPRDCYNKNYQD